MNTILDTIVASKKLEIEERKRNFTLDHLQEKIQTADVPRGFVSTLGEIAAKNPAIIAEVKRGSPSLGCIRENLSVTEQVKSYEQGGAAAISILTDEKFFFAKSDDFHQAHTSTTLPTLRKEFIIDTYQIYESRAMNADCILLIMSILNDNEAAACADTAHRLNMDVLVEIHTLEELRRLKGHVDYDLIGINNRNLKTFATSESNTREIAYHIPDKGNIVAESGLKTTGSIARLWDEGIRRFLVGEAFITCSDPANTVKKFVTCCIPKPNRFSKNI